MSKRYHLSPFKIWGTTRSEPLFSLTRCTFIPLQSDPAAVVGVRAVWIREVVQRFPCVFNGTGPLGCDGFDRHHVWLTGRLEEVGRGWKTLLHGHDSEIKAFRVLSDHRRP